MENPQKEHGENGVLFRAQGCLIGQLAGDSLGGLVEFRGPGEILRQYPAGVRELADGGTWNTLAGQPTDDSEMALMLARMLSEKGVYDPDDALEGYRYWYSSNPFDCGMTISDGLSGMLNHSSQANGAMMRISPLGIFGAGFPLKQVAEWAKLDAMLTHPHPICVNANALFAMAVAETVRTGCGPEELYRKIHAWAVEMKVPDPLLECITGAADAPPQDYITQQGWVLIAFGNALWQMLHAESLEEGVVDTVMQGGDTDTNAAICGALLGAVYGIDAIPWQWKKTVLGCRPAVGGSRVHRPRPACFWPIDALELAERLVP